MLVKFVFRLSRFANPLLGPIKLRLKYFIDIFNSGEFSLLIKNKPLNIFVAKPYSLIGGKYIEVGNSFVANAGLTIEALDKFGNQVFSPNIKIGENVFFNKNCRIQCINKITIGNNVMFGGNVFITDHFHGDTREYNAQPPAKRELTSKGPVIIFDSVWIGEGAVIMPNVSIGEGVIIGANSVVTRDVEANTVIAGNPAKVIRKLDKI